MKTLPIRVMGQLYNHIEKVNFDPYPTLRKNYLELRVET